MAGCVAARQRTERALRREVAALGLPIQPEARMLDIALGLIAVVFFGLAALGITAFFVRFD